MRVTLTAILLAGTVMAGPLPAQQLIVGVDQRVELLSIVFRLAGAPEYVNNDLPDYAAAVDSHFAAHRDHEAVRQAKLVRATLGVSHDAVMMMAIHLDALPTLRERVPFDDTTATLHQRWRPAEARAFAAALRRFVADADVAGFFAAQRSFHDSATARLNTLVERSIDPQWFDAFFGARAGDRFVLVPGLLNGGGSYGPRVAPTQGPEELYAIIGTWTRDSMGLPTFPAGRAYTIAHEFAHSYVNPVIQRHRTAFEGFSAGCASVADLMTPQAYRCWKTVVDESVVRATSVAWARANLPAADARTSEQSEAGRGFFWTGELADTLEAWRKARGAGASWEGDAARLGAWFVALGERLPAMRAAFEARRPEVVATSIPIGSEQVDAATTQLVVTFDRPMARGWSIQPLPSAPQGMAVPKFSAPTISADSLRFEVTIALEPATEYGFTLNGPFGGGFRTTDGIPLAQFPIRFRTAAR